MAGQSFGGGTPSTANDEFWNGDIPWLQSSDLAEHDVIQVKLRKHITLKGLDGSAAKLVPKKSIAIVTRVGVGKLCIVPFQYSTSQDFLSLSKLNIDIWFGVYVIYKKLQKELNFVQGTSIKGITKDELLNETINAPAHIPEQTAIGNFFRTLDDTITLYKRKLDGLKELKKGYLQQMFPQAGEDAPRVRFAEFNEPWEQRKLGELAEFSKGNGYSKSDLTIKGDPIILYGRLYTNYDTVIENIDTFTETKENSVLSQGGEVIVPSSGETSEDISRASVVAKAGVILGGDLNIVKPDSTIHPAFLAITISNSNQQKELSKRAQGKSIVHISNSDLKEVVLQLSSVAEQTAIGNFFRAFDEQITMQQSKLDELKQLKSAYLQKMFI